MSWFGEKREEAKAKSYFQQSDVKKTPKKKG
jgi:hypothetical protein